MPTTSRPPPSSSRLTNRSSASDGASAVRFLRAPATMLWQRVATKGRSMAIRKKQPGLTRPARKALVTGPTSTDWRTIKNLRAAIEREQDEQPRDPDGSHLP